MMLYSGLLTIWETVEDGTELPFGQKMLTVDDDEVPILSCGAWSRVAAAAQ